MALELYKEAQAAIEKLLKFHTRNPRYQAFLGNYYYIQKDFKKALDIFETLIKITGSREYYSETGWLKFLQNKKKKATDDLILATTQGNNKTRALAHYRLGLIYALKQRQQQESSKNYTRAYELAPKLPEAKRDHQMYSEITKIESEKTIIQKMMRLYVQ